MGKGKLVAKIIERARARYEVEEAEYGKVYRWQPETVVVECGCGEETALTPSDTVCEEWTGRSTRSSSGRIWLTDSLKMMKTFTAGGIWGRTERHRTEAGWVKPKRKLGGDLGSRTHI